MAKYNISYLDVFFIILFIVLLIKLPDIDIQYILENIGINTTIQLTALLVVLLLLSMVTYCYYPITGGIIFICITLFLRTQFKYVEAFYQLPPPIRLTGSRGVDPTNPQTTNPQTTNPQTTKKNKDLTVEEYLLNQIVDDPNKTNLEKEVIKDITQKYFLNSDKLQKLTDFNEESEKYSLT